MGKVLTLTASAFDLDLEVGGEPSLQINHGAGHGLEAGVLRVQVLTPEMEGSGET